MREPRKAPTMADVARVAGVSAMTVSRALKSTSSVNPDTRKAILEAAEAIGYVLDGTASSFRLQRSGFVAATIPSIDNANFAAPVGALTEGLKAAGLEVLLGATNYDLAEEERLIEQFLRRRPEAIVVTGGSHTDRARRMLEQAAIPLVETWDLPAEPIGHVVGFSNAAAIRTMVDHFADAGYRDIAFIGGEAARDSRGHDRRQGFVEAMTARGLDAGRLIDAGPPPISVREGALAMRALIERGLGAQAVICVSDLAAFGALTECQRQGLAVPRDVAIGGFGAYEIAAYSVPTLTTIDARAAEIGAEAARLVTGLLDGRIERTERLRIEVPYRLLIGQSS